MRFTVRSLGGKLVISAALTLLLCMLLFSAASWYLLKFFYERDATNDATKHLTRIINRAYPEQVATLIEKLNKEASIPEITAALSKHEALTPGSLGHLRDILGSAVIDNRLSSSAIISRDRRVLVGIRYPDAVPAAAMHLVNQALNGET